ncbi:hypothetical protein AAY473_008980 [Plecturocebus cupreus]
MQPRAFNMGNILSRDRFHHVGQVGPELLTWGDLAVLASQAAVCLRGVLLILTFCHDCETSPATWNAAVMTDAHQMAVLAHQKPAQRLQHTVRFEASSFDPQGPGK